MVVEMVGETYTDEIESEGIRAMSLERNRQVHALGYDKEHDDKHYPSEFFRAAACYMDWAASQEEGVSIDEPHAFWPWEPEAWNPGVSALRAIEKAGALAAAGYDLIRMEILNGTIPQDR